MAKDRARDDRRSVGSHEKIMGALGRAAGWERVASIPGFGDVIGETGPGKARVRHVGQPHVAVHDEDYEKPDK